MRCAFTTRINPYQSTRKLIVCIIALAEIGSSLPLWLLPHPPWLTNSSPRLTSLPHSLSGSPPLIPTSQPSLNPRTAGGLTHLRTAGGRMTPPPQRSPKLRKIATSGKRRSIGRGKFYKTCSDHFLIRSNLRSQGVKKVKFSQNRAIFAANRNYLNNYTN